jgi:hypothetical protein
LPEISADAAGRLRTLVDSLGYDLEPSILIGGWATYLRVGGDISQDIDLIINDQSLRATLRDKLDDYSENSRHSGGKKARGTVEGVHIDAYFPHESRLGDRLLLEVDKLAKYTDDGRTHGWVMLTLDAHIATKLAALLDRPDTEKGEKDAREIVRLVASGGTGAGVVRVLLDATAGDVSLIPGYVELTFELLPDRGRLNKKERRTYQALRREWVDEAERQLRALRAERDGGNAYPTLH